MLRGSFSKMVRSEEPRIRAASGRVVVVVVDSVEGGIVEEIQTC